MNRCGTCAFLIDSPKGGCTMLYYLILSLGRWSEMLTGLLATLVS